MNKLVEILRNDFTEFGVEFTDETILGILKSWVKDYNKLKEDLNNFISQGLTNEQIAKEFNGHNVPKHSFEYRICDLNYKSLLTTIYPNNTVCEHVTGYLDTDEIKSIINSVKKGQSTICSDFMYEDFSIEIIKDGINYLESVVNK